MKTIKKGDNFDAIAEARKDENYLRYFRGAALRLRLADEIYSAREIKGLSQQALARNIFSTQKVISRIENGDVNIGIEMFDRLSEELDLTTYNLLKIFDHIQSEKRIELKLPETHYANEVKKGLWDAITYPVSILQGFRGSITY